MLKCFNVKIKKGGFTLIEMLASVMIFSLIIGAISGVFISSFRSQKNALSSQRLLNQTSYALEYMSRALRMSQKQTADIPTCLSQNGLNYEITHSGSGLKFINHLEEDDCQEFFLEGVQLKYRKKIGESGEETLDLTSSNLRITSLNFGSSGWSQDDDLQPRVTIFLAVKGKGQKPEEQPEIKIQTTISQRNLDIKY